MPTHIHRRVVKVGGEDIVIGGREVAYTDEGEQVLDVTIAASQTNKEVAFTLDVAACSAFFLSVSGPCTIKTNSSSDPDYTFTFVATSATPGAGESHDGYVWANDHPEPFVLADDITKLYVTTPSGASVRIQARALHDATP